MLKTDYKDDKLDTSVNTNRKFEMVQNTDGSYTFTDTTDYTQKGDEFNASVVNGQNTEINLKSPINSPTFTGTPTAPTAASGTDDETVANCAFVNSVKSGLSDAINKKADIESPTLTGTPKAPTASLGTDNEQLATTSFVNGSIAKATSPYSIITDSEGYIALQYKEA